MAKFTTENSRGFNVLHWAVLKDNKELVIIIMINNFIFTINKLTVL